MGLLTAVFREAVLAQPEPRELMLPHPLPTTESPVFNHRRFPESTGREGDLRDILNEEVQSVKDTQSLINTRQEQMAETRGETVGLTYLALFT